MIKSAAIFTGLLFMQICHPLFSVGTYFMYVRKHPIVPVQADVQANLLSAVFRRDILYVCPKTPDCADAVGRSGKFAIRCFP